MDTSKRDEILGIWPLLLCALGCVTFTLRGIIAVADHQERMLEGVIFLTFGIVASMVVAHMIWQLAHKSKQSVENTQFDPAQSSRSAEPEE